MFTFYSFFRTASSIYFIVVRCENFVSVTPMRMLILGSYFNVCSFFVECGSLYMIVR